MARRPDPGRIAGARRAALVARLTSAGHPAAEVERLIVEWERGLAMPPSRADWEGFDGWLARRGRGPGVPRPP
jgi:hypothetical protein